MNEKSITHLPALPFSVVDNCLQWEGLSITRLAQQVGQTPFYAYGRSLIKERIQSLKQQLPAGIHLHYAMKANPMPELVQFIAPLVDGLDVASGGELRVALNAGMDPARISFAGPGKGEQELGSAIAAGITLNVESERELETIARLGKTLNILPRVAIRVNPDFELKTSGMKMGGRPTQFGIDAERVPAALRRIGELGLEFEGLHIFSGSQNLRPDAIIEAQSKTFELAYQLAAHAPAPLRTLNIGGGFGIPYFPGDTPLDLGAIAQNLEACLAKAKKQLPQAQVILELGRYLVGEAGIYVCRVIDRKVSRGQTFLITNGGLHHHLAASGNFGQVLRKNYPVIVANKITAEEKETVSVVGPLCTPLDLLADKMKLPRAEVGDLIAVLQSGAYGLTASPTAFLSHPPPMEVLI